MVMITVKKKDRHKVFKILFNNGRFSEIGNMYRIEEKEDDALRQIEAEHIPYKKV